MDEELKRILSELKNIFKEYEYYGADEVGREKTPLELFLDDVMTNYVDDDNEWFNRNVQVLPEHLYQLNINYNCTHYFKEGVKGHKTELYCIIEDYGARIGAELKNLEEQSTACYALTDVVNKALIELENYKAKYSKENVAADDPYVAEEDPVIKKLTEDFTKVRDFSNSIREKYFGEHDLVKLYEKHKQENLEKEEKIAQNNEQDVVNIDNQDEVNEAVFKNVTKNAYLRNQNYKLAVSKDYIDAETELNKGDKKYTSLQSKKAFGTILSDVKQKNYDKQAEIFYDYFWESKPFIQSLIGEARYYEEKVAPELNKNGNPINVNIYLKLLQIMDEYKEEFVSCFSLEGKSVYKPEKLIEVTDSMIGDLNDLLLYQNSDDNKLFNDFYVKALALNASTHELIDGRLFVPEKGAIINGKKAHFVSNVEKTKKDKYGHVTVTTLYQPERDSMFKEYTEELQEIEGPLFSHEPNPSDIKQGSVGDCYFLAALQGIAAQDPERIRDMIVDNNDGTATVRFYNSKQEPVYVTVDKTIPIYKDNDGHTMRNNNGENWVRIMEKAFAISGLGASLGKSGYFDGRLEDAENGKYHGSYNDVNGGITPVTTSFLLGTDSRFLLGEAEQLMAPVFYKSTGPYDNKLEKYFNSIKKAIEDKKIVSTAILNHAKKDEKYDALGLCNGHAYSITGTEVDNTGKKYIRIRNPHGTYTAVYNEENKLTRKDKDHSLNPGESLIELRDFVKLFRYTFANSYDFTHARRLNAADSDIVRENYGQAVQALAKGVCDADNWMLRLAGKNSTQFKELRESAMKLQANFLNRATDSNVLLTSMKDFFDKSTAYQQYCESRTDRINSMNERTAKRYILNSAIQELKKAFNMNNTKEMYEQKKVDVKELVTKAMGLKAETKEINGLKIRGVLDPIKKKAIEVLKKNNGLEKINQEIAETKEVQIDKSPISIT